MKKLVLFLVLLFCLVGSAQSQLRHCDLTIEIVSPSTGYLFESPGYDSVVVNVINLGPDTIRAVDRYNIQLKFGGVIFIPDFGFFNQEIVPNGKFPFTKRFKVNFDGNVDSFDLCMTVNAHSVGSDSLFYEKRGTTYDNNRTCIHPIHRDSSYVGVKQMFREGLNLYPNPCASTVFLPKSVQAQVCHVIDSRGVKREFEISANRINVGSLKPGVYVIMIEDGRRVLYSKVLKE